jgi:hypothetical protein
MTAKRKIRVIVENHIQLSFLWQKQAIVIPAKSEDIHKKRNYERKVIYT